ncbi:MAG: hypothetical protein QOF20_1624 [Acidimicrobiaceae bacterium]|nr:hypothetical protein [Acidimicrobiaceae bacterium]MDQ1376985.1 hypothetical protein [Acidimicrobiaceae bacterium]MDQ1399798.1 hypothetical protein [Acidimicrobiaceae bacterium]MDQ1414105.1 hypothetical protein [Acidimicrobiaceae bacterium]MDQ1417752.1 hypothetical protein [Acidimicrobiaceae bacterium]
MPVPLPSETEVKLTRPDATEVAWLGRGIVTAVRPSTGHTQLQDLLLKAVFESMTGFSIDPDAIEPIDAEEFATGLAQRNLEFRTRIVQVMLLGELILMPLPDEVSERVERFAAALGVDEGMIDVARDFAKGSMGLALVDFDRNGYTANWDEARCDMLHTTAHLEEAWQMAPSDPELAARWAALEQYPPGSLGRRVSEFYRSRGFMYPGLPGSAPPYLAQHDWVHILADYGTTVESELEVFGLIGRAIPDFKGFSLLAMVVSLFETGYLPSAAGLFQADKGHLSRKGMPERLGDAMRRGALCGKDLMGIDWFSYADAPVVEVRRMLNVVAKGPAALVNGSVGPWEHGGISPYQANSGRKLAESEGRVYESYGASVA